MASGDSGIGAAASFRNQQTLTPIQRNTMAGIQPTARGYGLFGADAKSMSLADLRATKPVNASPFGRAPVDNRDFKPRLHPSARHQQQHHEHQANPHLSDATHLRLTGANSNNSTNRRLGDTNETDIIVDKIDLLRIDSSRQLNRLVASATNANSTSETPKYQRKLKMITSGSDHQLGGSNHQNHHLHHHRQALGAVSGGYGAHVHPYEQHNFSMPGYHDDSGLYSENHQQVVGGPMMQMDASHNDTYSSPTGNGQLFPSLTGDCLSEYEIPSSHQYASSLQHRDYLDAGAQQVVNEYGYNDPIGGLASSGRGQSSGNSQRFSGDQQQQFVGNFEPLNTSLQSQPPSGAGRQQRQHHYTSVQQLPHHLESNPSDGPYLTNLDAPIPSRQQHQLSDTNVELPGHRQSSEQSKQRDGNADSMVICRGSHNKDVDLSASFEDFSSHQNRSNSDYEIEISSSTGQPQQPQNHSGGGHLSRTLSCYLNTSASSSMQSIDVVNTSLRFPCSLNGDSSCGARHQQLHPQQSQGSAISRFESSGHLKCRFSGDAQELENEDSEFQVCEWDGCGNTFTDMQEFVRHLEDKHVNQEPRERNRYFCLWSNCKRNEQEFNARYKLLIHMRVHSGEKPYSCSNDSCKKSFSRLENLKIHVRSHTGEKPYKCSFPDCPKSFTNSSDRIKHHKTHKDPKPYPCTHEGCPKRYTDPSSLRKHLRAHKRQWSSTGSAANTSTAATSVYAGSSGRQQQQQQQLTLAPPGEPQLPACPADYDPSVEFPELTGDAEGRQYVEQIYEPPTSTHRPEPRLVQHKQVQDTQQYQQLNPRQHQPAPLQQQYLNHRQLDTQLSRSWCEGSTRRPPLDEWAVPRTPDAGYANPSGDRRAPQAQQQQQQQRWAPISESPDSSHIMMSAASVANPAGRRESYTQNGVPNQQQQQHWRHQHRLLSRSMPHGGFISGQQLARRQL